MSETEPARRPASGAPPDYFDFVAIAREQLPREMPTVDAMANRVILTLSRASSQIIYDMEASIHRPKGGSWAAYRLMFTLWLAGPMESNRAAKLSGLSRAAVSNLTNRLVQKRLLSRRPAESDGRAVTLSLTEDGMRDIREVFQAQNQRETQWARALSGDEQELLVTLLEKLMSHRSEIGGRARD